MCLSTLVARTATVCASPRSSTHRYPPSTRLGPDGGVSMRPPTSPWWALGFASRVTAWRLAASVRSVLTGRRVPGCASAVNGRVTCWSRLPLAPTSGGPVQPGKGGRAEGDAPRTSPRFARPPVGPSHVRRLMQGPCHGKDRAKFRHTPERHEVASCGHRGGDPHLPPSLPGVLASCAISTFCNVSLRHAETTKAPPPGSIQGTRPAARRAGSRAQWSLNFGAWRTPFLMGIKASSSKCASTSTVWVMAPSLTAHWRNDSATPPRRQYSCGNVMRA